MIPTNTNRRCTMKKCIGYGHKLVDRGYNVLVCPSTPTNPKKAVK